MGRCERDRLVALSRDRKEVSTMTNWAKFGNALLKATLIAAGSVISVLAAGGFDEKA